MDSFSFSKSGTAGNGGAIDVRTWGGAIFWGGGTLRSFAVSGEGESGDGGRVTLEANSKISGLTINTVSSGGQSGAVQVKGTGNLLVDRTEVKTAQQVAVCVRPPCNNTYNQPTTVRLTGKGQAGDVTVDSSGNLTFRNSVIQSDTRSGNPAGNISITSPGVISFNNSQIISNTSSSGAAGSITINASQIQLNDATSQIVAQTNSSGIAGNITLQPSNGDSLAVLFRDGAQISAATIGTGQGGSILVTAPRSIVLSGNGSIVAGSSSEGAGGSIQLTTRDLSLQNGVNVSASTAGAGKAGDVGINAETLTLSGGATVSTNTASSGQAGNLIVKANQVQLNDATSQIVAQTNSSGIAGNITLQPFNDNSLAVLFRDGAQISAATVGKGQGGSILVTAPRSIVLSGNGSIAAGSSSEGAGGSVQLRTRDLSLQKGVNVSASTSGAGKAGDVGINAETLTVSGGATVSTNTASSGQAGNLTVNVKDQLTLTGSGTGLFATTTPGSTGNGGSITIDPQRVLIQDGATIAVNSEGSGIGGNIFLQAGRLELRNRGSITAETASAQGGNITLKVSDVVLLRRSLISATAGTAQAGGNGGNVTISTPFVLGVLTENSDIRANAFSGNGGNVIINAQQIFGLRPQPQDTPFSDITASSQLGINGNIILNTLNLDPSQGLQELNLSPVDPSKLVAQGCNSGRKVVEGESKFVVLGRGGLTTSPDDPFGGTAVLTDLGSPTASASTAPLASSASPAATPGAIVEAQGWMQDARGKLYLVSQSASVSVDRTERSPAPCQSR
ncbi:beta strand repeat-containing protein [Stenomitos frigidus]|uniref:beta strand repeat-containing protein n=1 Tax=Stenomitos frigidus TaxID=1886765 RepID=UPI001FE96ECF|nr:S-layer family protein [Stenomitos frigidus]